MANPLSQEDYGEPHQRIPPHNEEAENTVLGVLLCNNAKLDELTFSLQGEDFYGKANQIIYQHINKLCVQEGKPADVITVADALINADKLEQAGGRDYLADLSQRGEYSDNFQEYALILRENAVLRRLLTETDQINQNAYKREQDTNEIVDDAERRVLQVGSDFRDRRGSSTRQASQITEEISEQIERLHERQKQGKSPFTGLITGYSCVDEATAGLQPGELTILAARPSVGKTAFALDIVRNVCKQPNEDGKQQTVVFFSLEMSSSQLLTRLLSVESSIDQHRLRTGKLHSEKDWQKFLQANSKIAGWNLWIDEASILTINDLRSRARRIRNNAEQTGAEFSLIVVDYLQLMSGERKESNRVQEISDISRGLKTLARELKVPILALSQLSRRIEDRGASRRPMLSDLRDSGSIEQDADLVMFLSPSSQNEQVGEIRKIDLFIGKNRNGPIGIHHLDFQLSKTHFVEVKDIAARDYNQTSENYDDPEEYNFSS